ncbi:hypothetical protein MLD38_019344 [Melastoma candidum]|uniref:Uncharacterized protein n=1 Tax=Melastoma candidum TaxID=119954 RepID=A0ACB9QWQ0_9MYRT|nr:hypothetical protein MLD38_019344 [Melastoma candidum]
MNIIMTTLKLPFVFTVMAIIFLITTPSFTSSARTQPKAPYKGGGGGDSNDGGGNPFGPGSGIPGFEGQPWSGFGGMGGGGYGFGFGGPSGGYSKGGVIRPTVVCKQKGPCYKKKLTCPAKCFTSYSRSGKGYGAGGGGGGCTMDCEKKCVAYC